jgi:hypothetical protein
MRNNFIFACFIVINAFGMDTKLTFIAKNSNILDANAKNICFKTSQRVDVEVEEECLKSKMAKKYDLNITMSVCQIEKFRKSIRYWCLCLMIILKREVI